MAMKRITVNGVGGIKLSNDAESGDYRTQITAFRCTLQIANATWFAICSLSLVGGIIGSGNEQMANQICVHKSSIVDQKFVPNGFLLQPKSKDDETSSLVPPLSMFVVTF